MKHAVITLSALAMLAMSAFVHAGEIFNEDFDVSNDDACWVAPEWRS